MGITIREFPERKRPRKSMIKIFTIGRWTLDENEVTGDLIAFDEVSGQTFVLIQAPVREEK